MRQKNAKMNEQKLNDLLNSLKTKKKALGRIRRSEPTAESRAAIERHMKRITSVCDRLNFNFKMLPDQKAAEFLENTVAEAELFLTD